MTAAADETIAHLRQAHRPAGRRLGIAIVPGVPPALADAAASALVEAGAEPERRLAWLRPRPGENRTRAEDVTWFIERFGHEYTVLVCLPEQIESDASLEEVCTQVGTALVVA